MGVAALLASLRRIRGGPYPLLPAGERPPITFPASFLTTRVYIALGADLAASYLTWNWLDITDRVRHDLGITVTAGRLDERSQVTPSRCTIKAANTDGYLCRLNPFSPYYGLLTKNTPIWIQLNPGPGFVDRYFGYVNEWPASWADESGNDSFVTIQCSGIMRRLGQRAVLKSALNRTMSGVGEGDFVPLAYLPMEDGTHATQVASGLPGGVPATVTGTVTFANNSDLAGSDSLPTLPSGAMISGVFPAYTDTNTWFLQIGLKIAGAPAADTTYLEVDSPGGNEAVWRLYIQPGSPDIVWFAGFDGAGASTGAATGVILDGSGSSNPSEADFYNRWWFFTLYTYINPTDGFVYGGIFMTNNGDWSALGAGAGTSTVHRPATGWRLYGRDSGVSAGHLGFWVDTAFNLTNAFDNAEAFDGYVGELAHERMRRLCREERIPFTTQAQTSAVMGPQRIGNILAVLRECEQADQGVLYEHQFGLAYQALNERYNQPVSFNLDFDAGHHAGIPEPRDDDQRLVNLFTASRTDGSSATEEKADGPLGTGPGGSGVFDDSATANVESDSQLADYASWRVHLGTVDEDRWPRIPFQLHRNPALIPSWLATPFGARINVANPPAQMNQDTIDAVIEGYTERWVQEAWEVALATSPASPYRIFTVEDTNLGDIDSGSSALAVEAAAGASSLTVATSNPGDLWTTDAADFPLTVQASGIDIEVTAVAGSSSPQTFTVTSADVTKTLPAGSVVELADPTYLGV